MDEYLSEIKFSTPFFRKGGLLEIKKKLVRDFESNGFEVMSHVE
jgi:hypothetical protein